MLRLTFKNLRAHKVRFALTTFGVVLAVSFVVSAFVMGDGLRSTFGNLSDEISAGVDVEVRPYDTFGATDALDDDDLAVATAVDGVEAAVGTVEAPENSVRPIKADGEEISSAGPPQLAFSWSDNTELSPFELVEGTSPEPGEFVMDLDAADQHGFVVGETYRVITATGQHELTLSGISRFGTDNETLGAVLMGMNTGEANELFGTTGYDSISITVDDGVDADAVMAELAASLPDFEVVDQATVASEQSADFNEGIDIVQNVLLGFGGVALFVSIFIIYNTFAIVLSQRTREMGLLRVVGADAGQLRRSTMGEALVIGVLASILGILGGLAVAAGLTALFGALGADLPDYPTIVSARTITVASVVGIGVTAVAAFGPTRRASRVSPVVALRDAGEDDTAASRTRIVAGVALGVVGVIAGGFGLSGAGSTEATIALMALGAVGVFVGVTLISPLLVGPVVQVVAWPLRRLGVAGKLAGNNARRNPRRTSTTAAALMIGLAVVTMALVVGESLKAQFSKTLESSVSADYIVNDSTSDAGFPTTLADEVAASAAFESVTGFKYVEGRSGGEIDDIAAADLAVLPDLLDLDVVEGDYRAEPGTAMVNAERAERDGLEVGDVVAMEFDSGEVVDLTVTGLFDDAFVIDTPWLVDEATLDAAGVREVDSWLAFLAAPSADDATVQAALDQLSTAYPNAEIDTAAEFRERVEGLVDGVLTVLNALVALAVVIALIGIANTLALSVHERTRELGLTRAVGMTRRQVRRMVRYESAIIAGFGALLGVAIGIGFGWATVEALPDNFTETLAVPTGRIVILLVTAAAAGLVAAWLPARRAARMNVLDAISH